MRTQLSFAACALVLAGLVLACGQAGMPPGEAGVKPSPGPGSAPTPDRRPPATPPAPAVTPAPPSPTAGGGAPLQLEGMATLHRAGPPESGNPWLDLLRLVPANRATAGEAWINHYAALRQLRDLPPPDPGAPPEAIDAYRMQLVRLGEGFLPYGPDQLGGMDMRATAAEWQQTLGFTWLDVDASLTAGAPPELYQAVRGELDRQGIDEAVRAGPLNDQLEVRSHAGIDYYTWGEDFRVDVQNRSGVRPLGRGHRLAPVEDLLLWAVWTEGVETMIDCALDPCGSLAELEEYQLLAQALDRLQPYAVLFSARTQQRQSDDPYLLEPYVASATGAGLENGVPYMAIALVHETETAAAANVERLRERISNGTSERTGEPWRDMIDAVEVEHDGRVLLARLRGGRAALQWPAFWHTRDPLLAHRAPD